MTANGRCVVARLPMEEGTHCRGPQGCGKCPECKRNLAKAKGKGPTAPAYLGLPTFAQAFPAPGWLTRAHWQGKYNSLSHRFPPLK